MQYVNIRAKTHAEALQQLRKQFGENALVLKEQQVPAENVIQRMLGRKEVLIKAALTEKKSLQETRPSLTKTVFPADFKLPEKNLNQPDPLRELIEKKDHRDQQKDFLSKVGYSKADSISPDSDSISELKNEIASLKKMIGMLPIAEQLSVPEFEELATIMKVKGFSHKYINGFLKELQRNIPESSWCDSLKSIKAAQDLLADRVNCRIRPGSKRIMALIGQTGVGKTTTIAKLATLFSLRYQRKIALYTIDNFRIAATEQLKIFADILSVEFGNARDPLQLRQMAEASDAEHIFLDCTGFNSSDQKASAEQLAFFHELPDQIEKHLVLSAASKSADLENIAKNFLSFDYDCFIFSKIDESIGFGNLVELSERMQKPVSYLTTGQNVPDDLAKATGEEISSRIFAN